MYCATKCGIVLYVSVWFAIKPSLRIEISRSVQIMDLELDENDLQLVRTACTSLLQLSQTVFPRLLILENSAAERSCADYLDVDSSKLISLIDSTLGLHYLDVQGPHWKLEKKEEMETPGLVYISYVCDDEVVAFVSYMVTYGDGDKTLYLYEIHVSPKYQHCGLGTQLLLSFHQLSESLKAPETSRLLHCTSSMLTVFTANTRALKWYFSNGYVLADESPVDRRLRTHVVVPEYYILKR